MTAGYKWKPLQRASVTGPPPPQLVKAAMESYGCGEAEAIAKLEEDVARCTYWRNDLYQIEVRPYGDDFVQLNIRRRDGAPCIRDWRHFQRIKNELLGPECEAVELYPAESRKVDAANKYHLWGCTIPGWRFPIGMDVRDVQDAQRDMPPGLRQRPLQNGDE